MNDKIKALLVWICFGILIYSFFRPNIIVILINAVAVMLMLKAGWFPDTRKKRGINGVASEDVSDSHKGNEDKK